MPSSPLGSTSNRMRSGVKCHLCPCIAHTMGRLRRGIPSLQLDNIYGWRTSLEACHHGPCLQNTVERRRAWKAIIALVQHRQGQITSAMSYDYRPLRTYTLGRCFAWQVIIGLGLQTHGQTTLACHHRLWIAHTDARRRAWHVLIALVLYIQSNDV